MNSSILRSPSLRRRSSVGRVRFSMNEDLRSVILDFLSGENFKPFEELLWTISDEPGFEEEKIRILNNCCNVVSLLDERMQRFVITVLNSDWMNGSLEYSNAFTQFLVELLGAHNYYTTITLEKLITSFAKVSNSEEAWSEEGPSETELLGFTKIHSVIDRVLKAIPMASELLLEVANSNFPYVRRSPKEHQVAVYNLLRICEYQPTLRPEVLSLVISRMVAIDVQIPRELLEELADSDDEGDMDVDTKTEQDTIFSIDDMASASQIDDTLSVKSIEMKLPMAQTLDLLMEQMFKFIKRHCERDGIGSWQHHRELYRELCVIFDKQLLLTHGSHHVQFIMFYLCSLRPPTLVEHFVGLLWSRVTSPGETTVARQSAACYVASLVSRANFVPPRLLRSVLSQMSNWCHAYIAAQQDAMLCDVRQHPVFYTVCQALFYVVAFRHADLVNSHKGLVWTQSLGLGKLVTCRLNPLKPCLPGVAQNFAAVTRTYQLAYCYTVMERNERATLPCINRSSGQPLSTRLSTFFPFDPYLLLRSSKFITSEYREYEALEQPAGTVASINGASDGEEEENSEVEDENMCSPVLRNSMSDCSLKHLVSPTSFPDMFSYSTSPGFKHV